MQSIASRGIAKINHIKPRLSGLRQRQVLCFNQAHAHGINQRIAFIGLIERNFACHCRHTHAIAVISDAMDDSTSQPSGARRLGRTKPQRIEHGNGPRAHGEDIAQDAAYARGRPGIRFNS